MDIQNALRLVSRVVQPDDCLVVIFSLHIKSAQFAADFRAPFGCHRFHGIFEEIRHIPGKSRRPCRHARRLHQFLFSPPLILAGLPEKRPRREEIFRLPGDKKLLRVNIVQSFVKVFPRRGQPRESRQIPVLVVLLRQMPDADLAIINNRRNPHLFMDRALPAEGSVSPEKLGAEFLVVIVDGTIRELIYIIHLHNLDLREQNLLHPQKRGSVFFIQHLVRVRRVNIFHPRLGESEVPRLRKVSRPRKIINPVGIRCRNPLRPIRGTCVHNDDLIRKPFQTVQTSA